MNPMRGLGLEMPDDKPDTRMTDFRLLAETSKQMARKAKTQTAREDYLRIALEWLQLADEAEALARLQEDAARL